jgi:hypothetical protein
MAREIPRGYQKECCGGEMTVGNDEKWSRCMRRWLQEIPIGNTKDATREIPTIERCCGEADALQTLSSDARRQRREL